MAIKFEEIKKYIARNARLSICYENGHYDDYTMMSDIPDQKYDDLYVYGVGIIDVEFSKDVYCTPSELNPEIFDLKDCTLKPAIEIVVQDQPRDIERSIDEYFVFKDLKPYLQIGRNFSIVNRADWSFDTYEYRNEIPKKYDDMYVYGIGMEDNPKVEKRLKDLEYDTMLKKRMVIVLSNQPRKDMIS